MEHQIRSIKNEDISSIVNLIRECDRLEAHSPFIYWILSNYFQNTTIVAQQKNEKDIIGFASAITSGNDPSVGYIWQVAVDPHVRNNGFGKELIKSIVSLCKEKEIKRLEYSIEPENNASLKMASKAFTELNIEQQLIDKIQLSVESVSWHENHDHYMVHI